MLNDPKKFHAANGASLRVRVSVGSLAVCCGLLGSTVAQADEGDRGGHHEAPVREMQQRDMQRELQQRELQQHAARAAEARQLDPRSFDARAEEQRRAMQESSSRNIEMHRGRLTPDERRDLRRQINEVGQDLYAHPPHH